MTRCYVLGAGFSAACGLPLARDLTKLVFDKTYPPGGSVCPDVREAYLKTLRQLFPACDLRTSWPDFEQLINKLDDWETCARSQHGSDPDDLTDTNPAHLKEVLLLKLRVLLIELGNSVSESDKSIVHRFVQKVLAEDGTIISFNWDLLLENACDELKNELDYVNDRVGALRVAKPHGSLNLVELTSEEHEETQEDVNVHSLDVYWQDEDRVVLRARNPSDAANRIQYPFRFPIFVEPNTAKKYDTPWIELQWERAKSMLQNAAEVDVIGYSLPRTDLRPRALLRETLNAKLGSARKRGCFVRLVDPNASQVAGRYRECIAREVELIDEPWGDWFSRSDHNLAERI